MRMRRFLILLLISAIICLSISCRQDEQPISLPKGLTELGLQFVDSIVIGEFYKATTLFSDRMKAALSPRDLENTWRTIIARNGPLRRIGGVRATRIQNFTQIFVKCEFEQGVLDMKLVFDTDDKIGGLWFVRSDPDKSYEPVPQTSPRLLEQKNSQTESAKETVALAKRFIELLSKKEFAEAVKLFDETMAEKMPEGRLAGIWSDLVSQYGQYKGQLESWTERYPEMDIVFIPVEFERAVVDMKVVVDPDLRISGLWRAKFRPTAEYEPPEYADRDSFTESDVTVGKCSKWELPGTLSMPKGDGPFPAAVLVHGSGPNDRDETVGPHKPFKDLAWGLASRGIAVLRYDKRTLVHRAKFSALGNFTVKEEAIDDALAAVDLMKHTKGIDANRIFVIGHSLGGRIAPRIGKLDASIAGLVSMAGPIRPMDELLLEQTAYLLSLDGEMSSHDEERIEKLKKQVAKVRDPNLSPEIPASELPLGIPASYWLDERAYNPAITAKSLDMPFLILQGARDYQVTLVDFNLWKEQLSQRPDVEFVPNNQIDGF